MRATGKDKSMDISFPFDHLQTIIDALTTIKNENENDELLSKLWRYKTVFHLCRVSMYIPKESRYKEGKNLYKKL